MLAPFWFADLEIPFLTDVLFVILLPNGVLILSWSWSWLSAVTSSNSKSPLLFGDDTFFVSSRSIF